MTQLWKEDAIMNRVKRAFLSREGVNGVRVAVRYFFELDTNKDGSISKEELSEGLAKHGLQLNADELNYLVKAFDTNRDGYISKEEFLAHLVGSLNNRRAQVVAKCYTALTARCGTPLRASDLIREFDASQHPLIKLGKATKDDIEKEFTGAFGVDADNDGYVSEREFQAFFTGVSATIPNDDVFETFMLRGLRADDPVAPRLAETERAWDKADPLGAPASMLHSAYSATLQATPQGKTYNASGLYRTKYNRPEPPLPSVRPDFVSTMKESYKPPTGAQLAASLPKKDFFSPTGNPILDLVRKKILDRVGTEGFVGLQRAFRTFDINRDQVITHTEIVKGLQRLQINLTPTEVKHVETAFDLNNGGGINLTEFCRVLRGPIRSPARVEILLLAFKTLDTSNDGLITVSEILPKYDVARHPAVKNGTKTPQQVIQDFIADWDANCDGIVTPAEWMDYYANISCTIDDDQYFELMIRNAWHISGGIGSAQNTTCRRVLATFKDGRQRVVEIENDMGLRKDDVDGMKDRLRAQGYADITAIQLAF